MGTGPANPERYNRTARALHWTIAALIIANLATGILHDPLEPFFRLMPLHKSIGTTILILSLVRLGWRFTWPAPAGPPGTSAAEKLAARAVHAIFYLLMLAMPLTGWIVVSAGRYPLEWFGVIAVPKLGIVKDSAPYVFGHIAHEWLGWLFLGLVVLHVAAAMRHHFLLRRML